MLVVDPTSGRYFKGSSIVKIKNKANVAQLEKDQAVVVMCAQPFLTVAIIRVFTEVLPFREKGNGGCLNGLTRALAI